MSATRPVYVRVSFANGTPFLCDCGCRLFLTDVRRDEWRCYRCAMLYRGTCAERAA